MHPTPRVNGGSGNAGAQPIAPTPVNVASTSSFQRNHTARAKVPSTERLSSAPVKAPQTLVSSGLWAEAAANISPEQYNLLQSKCYSNKPEELTSDIAKAVDDKKKSCEGKRWNLRGLDTMMTWLQKMRHIVDVAVSADPVHAALPWAAVKFVVEMIESNQKQIEQLSDGLGRITFLLERCSLYEGILMEPGPTAPRKNLRFSLVKCYAAVLNFMAIAIKTYEQGAFRRAIAIWQTEDVKRIQTKCQECENDAQIATNICATLDSAGAREEFARKLKQLPTLQQLESILEPLNKTTSAIWRTMQEKERRELLMWLSEISYEGDHKYAGNERTGGTGDWVFQRTEYKSWESSDKSNMLLLNGGVGTGKTKLVSRMIDRLLHQQGNNGIAFFYCKRGDQLRTSAESILRCYIKQLCSSRTNGAISDMIVGKYEENCSKGNPPTTLDEKESQEYLQRLIVNFQRVTLILDGLDECSEKEQEKVIRHLECLVKSRVTGLKVLISSRPNGKSTRHMRTISRISINSSDNQHDIRMFVQSRVSEDRNSGTDKKLDNEIVNTICKNSDGMFQWAALQVDAVLRESFPEGKKDRLRQLLPKNLDQAYEIIFREIEKGEDTFYPKIAERAFQWIFFAFEPLSADALIDFLRKEFKLNRLEPSNVLEACCNLLVLDTRCQFSHVSVREYFETLYNITQGPQCNDYGHTSLAIQTLSCMLDTNDAYIDIDRYEQNTAIFHKYSSSEWKGRHPGEFKSATLPYAASSWHRHAAQSGKIEGDLQIYIIRIFSESFLRAYFNWLHITRSDVGRFSWRTLRTQSGNFSQLQLASVLGFKSAVENQLEQGVRPSRPGGFRDNSEVVQAASAGQLEILQSMLKSLPASDRNQQIESVLENVGRAGQRSVTYLWECGFLQEGVRGKPMLKERFAIASARNHYVNAMEIFFTLGDVIEINQKIAKEAAANRIGDSLIKTLLGRRGDKVLFGKNVMKAAVKNESCGDKIVQMLLERNPAKFEVEKDLLETAAQNWGCGLELLPILLGRANKDSILDGSVIEAAATNEESGVEMLQFLLGQMPRGFFINERILVAAAQNSKLGLQLLPMLLDRRDKRSKIEQSVVEAAIQSNPGTATHCVQLICIILEKSGKLIRPGGLQLLVPTGIHLRLGPHDQARMLSYLIDLPGPDISHEMCLMGMKMLHVRFQEGKIIQILASAQSAHG